MHAHSRPITAQPARHNIVAVGTVLLGIVVAGVVVLGVVVLGICCVPCCCAGGYLRVLNGYLLSVVHVWWVLVGASPAVSVGAGVCRMGTCRKVVRGWWVRVGTYRRAGGHLWVKYGYW